MIACALTCTLALPASAAADEQTFQYTGAAQDWVVPYGVTSAYFQVWGAEGRGFDCDAGCRFQAGDGGWAAATIPVTPRSTVRVMVGGEGGPNAGGFNGGGGGGNGGGGASDIRIGGTALANRVLVAGGGGGTGGCADQSTSPFGGYGSGGPNGWAGQSSCGGTAGGGGTQASGGSPNGALGQGGAGGSGGGGGGYYGGGGGQSTGAGGGGSGFGPAGYAWESGSRDGPGMARVTYTVTDTKTLFSGANNSGSGPDGEGYVTSSPAGINCSTDDNNSGTCFAPFGTGQPVTLTAHPAVGTIFTGWGGPSSPCPGAPLTCSVTMSSDKIVVGFFVMGPRRLTVSKPGNGAGTVTSAPAGIDCGSTCFADYDYDTPVTLTAEPATGSDFTGWSGPCSGTSTCTVTMNAVRSVGANFVLEKRSLSVTRTGAGLGTVTSGPAGISCGPLGSACSADFDYESTVTLTATPDSNSDFSEWTGPCASAIANVCTVNMSAARLVDAKFTPKQRQLTSTTEGTGAGTVAPSPAGSPCGAGCSSYAHGTAVALTASPNSTSVFSNWTGVCTGSNPVCNLFMNQDGAAVAVFTLQERALNVGKSGNGNGSITSDPAGISCGLACASESTDFDINSSVALTATAATGSDLLGWSGPCAEAAGSPVCTVTMSEARTVTAEFSLQARNLDTSTSGNGAGDVVVDPPGSACGTGCKSFDYGTEVTLTATPATGSDFTGWTGACTGSSATCTVAMDQARSVDAGFTLRRLALTLIESGSGSGSVVSSPAGESFDYGTAVTLSASPSVGSSFEGWSGGCSGSAAICSVTMDQARTVSAEFSDDPPLLSGLKVSPRKVRMRGSGIATLRRRGPEIKLNVSEASTVEFRLFRRGQVLRFKVRVAAGSSSLRIPASIRRKIRRGHYVVTATAVDTQGQRSAARWSGFRVIRR